MAQELISTPHSYHDLLSRLDDIRQEYQRLGQSYRSSLYQLMAHSMGIALEIESDEQGKDQFLKSVGQKSDVVYAAMIFISDAKTEGARKKASKAARALRYLVEHIGVSLDNIPEGIREHGGIEELARLAAQDNPRRKPSAVQKADGAGEGGADQSDAKVRKGRGSGDKSVVQFGVPPKLRAKLNGLADSTAIRISAVVRAPAGEQPRIEVQDIELNGLDEQSEDESDWDD
jgi:hypothetical protein